MNKAKIFIASLGLLLLGAACTPGDVKSVADGGLWFSINKGENWQQKSLIYSDRASTKTIADSDIRKIVFSSVDKRKILVVTAKDGLWLSWNAGGNWDQILASPDVIDVAVHPDNPHVIYATSGPNVVKSVDEGDSWKAIYTGDINTDFITTVTIKPTSANIIYASSSKGKLLISEDSGTSWREIASLGSPILKMEFHPANANLIYAGVANKGLATSTNAGADWGFAGEMDFFKNLTGAGEFRDFALTPTGIVYASKFGLLRTLNQGRDWTILPLISGKNDSNIISLNVNPSNPLEIFYGTRSTFYHSLDGGFNWIPRSLPTTRGVSAILINPDDTNQIYMGVTRFR